MSKITLPNVANLIDTTTAQAVINSNSSIIQTAVDNTLSRDGTSPNQMQAPLDMNSNQIINLPAPATTNSALRLSDLTTFNNSGTITNIPVGGTTGQVITKTSNTDYQIGWSNSVTSVGLSMPADFTVTGSPVTSTGTLNAGFVTPPTGTGAFVRAASPTLSGTVTVNGAIVDTGGNVQSPSIKLAGATSGTTTLQPVAVASGTITVPAVTDTLVGKATVDTLTNKTLTAPVISTISNTGTLTLPTSTDTLVGRATTDTLTNKTLTAPVISTISNTGTLTLPTSTDTLVGKATTDTLTNKTLTAPVISTISNAGTLTLPTGPETLVGRATTDTLTNKTISGASNTLTNIANASLTNSTVSVAGTSIALGSSGGLSTSSNAIGSDVLLNSTGTFFTGPSMAQGSTGTWFASGTVTLTSTGSDQFQVKLWDGTTVIAQTETSCVANQFVSASISGFLTSPAGNIRISVNDVTSVNGKISSALTNFSSVWGIRIS